MQKTLSVLLLSLALASCTTQQQVVKVEPQVQAIQPAQPEELALKRKVAIARFSNETQYAKGIFYTKENDPISKQASDILSTKLAASNKFILLERDDLDKVLAEVEMAGNQDYQKVAADYLILGSVTEFGRKNVGDVNAFSRSKTQTVQAGVSVRLVDVATGQIIYSEEAKGEAETTNKTVMGMGERTDYDATLSDKAISAAISKLTENIISNCMDRTWKSYFLSYDEDGIFVSGGKSQNIKVGDFFDVVEKGKKVKNPQNGMMMELPGKTVGKIKIIFSGGDSAESEFSMVEFVEGTIDQNTLSNYYIKEIK
ncbi:MAG: CsgG/HfaB family protein [Bacteroidales bacterium]|nr:CsgG/HfaB family protein [Bacteroidales bacterium]